MHREEEKKSEMIKMDKKREIKKITLRKHIKNYEENQKLTRLIKKTKINKMKAKNIFFYKARIKYKKQENNENQKSLQKKVKKINSVSLLFYFPFVSSYVIPFFSSHSADNFGREDEIKNNKKKNARKRNQVIRLPTKYHWSYLDVLHQGIT